MHTSPFSSRVGGLLAALVLIAGSSSAQNPHVGMYVGDLTVELSGAFNSGPTTSGRMIFNIFPDGTVAEIGGDPVGTVSLGGAITWEQPNTFNFSSGTIVDGSLVSQSSTTENSLTRTLTIEAELLGGAFPSGQTFTNQLLDLSPKNGYRDHNHVIAANGGFIAVGDSGAVALSDDGLTWRRSAAPTARDLNAVAFGNDTYLIGGDHGVLMTSTDGVNWVPRNTPFQFNHGITGVAFGDGKFVISSQFSNIATSTDGISWVVQPTALASFLPGQLRYLDGQFVFWAGTDIRFSADGGSWSAPVNAGISTIHEVGHGDSLWIAGGSSGIAVSGNGTSWTTVLSGSQVRTVGFGNGRYVASMVGSNGAIHYASGAGATAWQLANGAANGGHSIAFDGERFVVAGASLGTSLDGIAWQSLVEDSRSQGRIDQQIFTNSDGSRDLIKVWKSTVHSYQQGIFWVGPGGAAYFDSSNYKSQIDLQTTADLFAVAKEYAGGEGGVIRRFQMLWDGSAYAPQVTPLVSPTTQTLRDGVNYANDVMLVGDGGTIVRFSGNDVILDSPPTSENLRFVDTVLTNNNSLLPGLTMVVGDNGTMFVRPANSSSPGGWVARDTGTTANLIGVAYVTTNFSNNTDARYIAVGEDGTLISSADSVTWQEESPILTPVPLDRFMRVQAQFNYQATVSGDGYNITIAAATTDGVYATGTPAIYGGSGNRARVVHGGDRFVMINGNRSYMSPDGREWRASLTLGDFRDVVYGGGKFVAVSRGDERFFYSIDGLTWQPGNEPGFNRNFEVVVYVGGRFIACANYGFIATSENGIDWTELHPNVTPSERFFTSMVHDGGDIIVAVGSSFGGSRTIVSSVDGGANWALRQDTGSSGYNAVAYGNGTFVAVGGNYLARSTDGINFITVTIPFSASSTGSTPSFEHIFFANGQFVATTASGQAYVSADGVSWAERFTGVRGTFTGSAQANGQVLLVTPEKVISLAVEDEGSPYVVQQPQSTSVIAGEGITLTATAIGDGPLSYQWTRDGVPVEDDARISGATTLTLQIDDTVAGDAGQYRLVVTNPLGGRTSQPAELSVLTPPVIVSQPQSLTAAPEDEVILAVAAEGGGLSYQWFKNDVLVPGANGPTLVIGSVTAADAGLYTVELTNLAGTVPSLPAALSLSSPPGGSIDLNLNTAFNANVPELRATNLVFSFGSFPAFSLSQLRVQPDGKILVAGQFEYTGIGGQTRQSLLRLNPDGTLDTTFNLPTLQIDGHNGARHAASIEQATLLSDGRIVMIGNIPRVGGSTISNDKLVMLNPDGTHVAAFAPFIQGVAQVSSVAVDSNDRIVVAGNQISGSSSNPRHLRRFLSTGAVDTTFSGASPGHAQVMSRSLVIQADDKAVYSAYTSDFMDIRTYRVTGSGTIDGNVQSSGFGGSSLINSHTPLPDGAFLVNGSFTEVDGTPRSGIARFAADGNLDASFDSQGELTGSVSVHATAPLAGGFYFSVGAFTAATAANLGVFGGDGTVQEVPAFGSGTNLQMSAVAANADGSIAYAGGNFTTLDGQSVPKIIRFDASATAGGDPLDLEIIAVSAGRSFVDGEDVVLTVAATGGNLTYQWFKDDVLLPDETGMSLTFSDTSEADAASYRVEVSDGSGMVPSADIVLSYQAPPATGFAGWSALLDLPEDQRGPDADPDGDGIANVIEWLYGLDANATDVAPEFFSAMEGNDGATLNSATGGSSFDPAEDYFTFSVLLPDDTRGATLSVQTSEDLSDFATNPIPVEQIGAPVPEGAGFSRVTYALTMPIRTAPKAFVRLKVEL